MNFATKKQARSLIQKLKSSRILLLKLFPNMRRYKASIQLVGDRGNPVIQITWMPGYIPARKSPLSAQEIAALNENWAEISATTLADLPRKYLLKDQGKTPVYTTYLFQHIAGPHPS